jgi:hypothetical protein
VRAAGVGRTLSGVSMKAAVRRSGGNVWRPTRKTHVANTVGGLVLLALTVWLLLDDGPLSIKDTIVFLIGDVVLVIAVPTALFRWRIVLEKDELLFVFLRVRRLAVRDIVEAKCIAGRGVVFVSRDGSDESTCMVANGAWAHRRASPTRADLLARAVLCAAAEARGEVPPVDYRLPPATGFRRVAIRGGIVGFLAGLFLGN